MLKFSSSKVSMVLPRWEPNTTASTRRINQYTFTSGLNFSTASRERKDAMPLDFRLAGIDCTSHEENWTLERPYLSRFVEYQRKGEGTEHNSSLNVIMSSNLSAKFAFQCRDIPRGVHKSQKFCQKFRSHAC